LRGGRVAGSFEPLRAEHKQAGSKVNPFAGQ
jgi:hypothetical protein